MVSVPDERPNIPATKTSTQNFNHEINSIPRLETERSSPTPPKKLGTITGIPNSLQIPFTLSNSVDLKPPHQGICRTKRPQKEAIMIQPQ